MNESAALWLAVLFAQACATATLILLWIREGHTQAKHSRNALRISELEKRTKALEERRR